MPYINVDEAYILDNTGLQVDQVVDIPYTDAALTETQKEQARKNIAAGGTNPNLITNPFFKVNQRGLTTYTASANTYTVDRFTLGLNSLGTGTVTVDTDGITIANGYASGAAYFVQKLDEQERQAINGKTVTMSVLYQDGSIKTGTGTFNLGTTAYLLQNDGEIAMRMYSPNTSRAEPTIDVQASKTIAIKAVKLELGSVSTIANDVPPDYASELAKCKYYFERIGITSSSYGIVGTGVAGSATSAYIIVPCTPKRVTTYSITMSGSWRLLGAANHAVSSMTRPSAEPTNTVVITCASTSLTTGEALMLQSNNDQAACIDISADL